MTTVGYIVVTLASVVTGPGPTYTWMGGGVREGGREIVVVAKDFV